MNSVLPFQQSLPAESLADDRILRVKNLRHHLQAHIRGQDHAIDRVADVIDHGELGLTERGKPKGRMLFLGPTGVGKTETAKLLSSFLFGENHFFRFDMSEYKHPDSLVKFIGNESGDLGRLGEVLDSGRARVLLFDELEKAHRDVLMLFLQLLDDARITCGRGRTFDLSDVYIVATSNIGGRDVMTSRHLTFSQIERHVLDCLRDSMPPEFGPRFPTKVVFNRLSTEAQFAISRDILSAELARLQQLGHELTALPEVFDFLVRVGFDRINGARPMKDAVHFHLRNALAEAIKASGKMMIKGTIAISNCQLKLSICS